jgi:hypothetical protein
MSWAVFGCVEADRVEENPGERNTILRAAVGSYEKGPADVSVALFFGSELCEFLRRWSVGHL